MRKKRLTRKRNKAYQKGYRFELRTRDHFRKLGYYVKRSYASKGAEDLLAIKKMVISCIDPITKKQKDITVSESFVIQCKNLAVEKKLNRSDADRLITLAKQCGATPLLAFNRNRKLVIVEVE